MDPERDQLKPLSASTGFETPGEQGHPSWETGRTTAAGCLPAGASSNLGGNTSSPTQRVTGTRAGTATSPVNSSKFASLQASSKPKDKEKDSEEDKQFDPGGKGKKPPPWNAAVMVLFFFLRGSLGHGWPVVCASCFLSVRVCLSCFSHQVIIFQRAEKINGDAKKANEERNLRASIILPINSLKMAKIITTVPGSMCRNTLGIG